jgi:8-hydroxy-5-deazaflavin:NADPH oxidoreductase
MEATVKIAILGGTGEQGPGLALRLAMAGEEVIIGSRSQERAEKVAAELNAELGRALIHGLENPQAAEAAEIVVLTVPYTAHLSTLESVKAQVQGKIFIDVSVPLDPDNPRRMKMPPAGSATEEAQAFFGPETKVVAAFQNVSAHLLRDPHHAIDCDVLVCGNDAEAKKAVMGLVAKMGLQAYDVGPAESARVTEGLTSILIRLNIRYKVKGSGIRLTGLPR